MAQGIPHEVRQAVGFLVAPEHVRFVPKDNHSRNEAWNQCELPHNPWVKAHTENYWVWFAPKGIDASDVSVWVQNQINVIESDSRYHDKPAAVQVNAPLALVQISLKTRLQVLQQVQILLKEGNH